MTLGGEAGALVGGEALMLVLMPAEPGARALRSKSPCGYRIAFLAGSSRTSLFLSQHQHAVASRWTLDCVQTECKSGPPESFSPFSTFLFLTGTIPTIRPVFLVGKTVIRAAPAERRCRNAEMVDRRRWC